MDSGSRGTLKAVSRIAALMMAGASLSACSSIPGWVDPTTWMGPDTPDTQASNATYPNLSNIPQKPAPASTPDDQALVAQSLNTAGSQVEYSAQALRGGTEAAAPAPTAAQVAEATPPAEAANQSGMASTAQPTAAEPTGPTPAATTQAAVPAQSNGAPPAETAPAEPAAAPSQAAALPSAPLSAEPAFAPSKAPALDAGVVNYVPPSVVAHYAGSGSIASPKMVASNEKVHLKAPHGTRRIKLGTGGSDVGGPEAMSGAVVADLGTLPASAALADASQGTMSVHFAGAGTMLTGEGRKTVLAAVQAYKARGDQGFVRVIGYGAGTAETVGRIEANFARAQARARHVAEALIRAGVPADKVLVDAQGQAPAGEAGRATIVLQ